MEAVLLGIEGVEIDSVQKYRNLALAPLVKQNGQNGLEYLVLEDALKSGLAIKESQSVPELDVENRTGKEVVIVTGEYVVGGGQNRMVAANIYLAPGFVGKIPVHCVQHGRWNPVPGKEFGYGGHTTLAMKSAPTQHDVWEEVTTTILSSGTRTHTEDYHEVSQQKGEDIGSMTANFKRVPNQVGLIIVMGLGDRKKFALDLFDKPDTLERHYEKILQAHALEALQYVHADIVVGQDEIDGFWNELRTAQFAERNKISLGTDCTVTTSRGEGSALVKDKNMVYVGLISK